MLNQLNTIAILTALADPVIYGLWKRFDVALQRDFRVFRGANQLAG